MNFDKLEYEMQTANGLPEFDSLSYGSEMLINSLEKVEGKEINHAVVLNPGQGHVAAALWKTAKPESITLVDRDLLALCYAQRNLILNSCSLNNISLFHQHNMDFQSSAKIDLFIGSLREDESKEAHFLVLDQMSARLSDKGIILLASGSTPITRLADYISTKGFLRIKARERRRGFSFLVIEHIK
jgi:hypothetical protein